ncbi:hypothetical protein [Nocardia altamirensis]|uniref:hypothetical protein n=1 Tax=Nocardia altamirensis TaxID=472158 RepID=UPI000A012905|nr:hypothetical protein [Nocardia altamirensis]
MGAYSTTSQQESSAAAKNAVSATSQHLVSNRSARTLSTIISRTLAWLIFLGGIVGAVLGIAGLHVEITVAGLILACTAGLILLKLRRRDGGGNETD